MTKTKANRSGHVFSLGDRILVFGTRLAWIASIHGNGDRVKLSGEYSGFTHVDNVKPRAVTA